MADYAYLLHSGNEIETGDKGFEFRQGCSRGAAGLVIKPTLFPIQKQSLDQNVLIKKVYSNG
jgi:hypothetical protein